MSSQMALAVFLLGSEQSQCRIIPVPKVRCISHFRYPRMSDLIPGWPLCYMGKSYGTKELGVKKVKLKKMVAVWEKMS